MRSRLLSDTGRPPSHSAVGSPLPKWLHARSFSGLLSERLVARLVLHPSARGSLRGLANGQRPRWNCPRPTLPLHPSRPVSEALCQRGPRRVPGVAPLFPRELAASRNAFPPPPSAIREPALATRELNHRPRQSMFRSVTRNAALTPTRNGIPETPTPPDSQLPVRRQMWSMPSHSPACPTAPIRTNACHS